MSENKDGKYYCSICKKDFTEHVEKLGDDSWGFHIQLHQIEHLILIKEVVRLRKFIKESFEESSYMMKQKIKKVLVETPKEIKSILDQ